MSMVFEQIKASIVSILVANQGSDFIAVGYENQVLTADDILGNKRRVQARYKSGSFPKGRGRISGSNQHQMDFEIVLMVSRKTKVDLATINNVSSTPVQIAAAIASRELASQLAEDSTDELIGLVYQILMSAAVYNLGLSTGVISSAWIDNIQKNDPVNEGEYVILTATMILSCSANESVSGEAGIVANNIDTTLILDGDPNLNTGVENDVVVP